MKTFEASDTRELKIDDGSFHLVGTVYLQAKPEQPAYVKVGSQVHKGDVVCIIEAMKMMTEVKSDQDGIISAVKVKNGELVEVDQPLFEVTEG